MKSRKGPGRRLKFGAILGVFAAGVCIVALTVYAIISLTAPPQPEHEGITPPKDNTPYPGKKW